MKNIYIIFALMLLSVSIVYALPFDNTRPWHDITQLSVDNGTTGADVNSDGVIDNATTAFRCDGDEVCETTNISSTGDANVTGTVYASAFSSNSPLILQTSGTTRLFINDTTGYVGIGTTSPESSLDIEGDIQTNTLKTDKYLLGDEEIMPTEQDIWLGQNFGLLQACDTSGTCSNHGNKAELRIMAMKAYAGKLWIGEYSGNLSSCDETGTCQAHGVKGTNGIANWNEIRSMEVYKNKLWLGTFAGQLIKCDQSGDCIITTDFGSTGLMRMKNYAGKLWLHSGGNLYSCDESGTCTDHGALGLLAYSMAVFDGKLWVGGHNGIIKACDSSGTCETKASLAAQANAMEVYDDKIWIGVENSHLYSCDENGNCQDHGLDQKILSLKVNNGRLWAGLNAANLFSYNTSGQRTDHGNKGGAIYALEVYKPSTKWQTMYINKGNIGINTSLPTHELNVEGEANISRKLYTPEVCIGGDCRTSWPSAGASESPWDNNSVQTFIRDTYPRFVNISDTVFVNDVDTMVGINTTTPNKELTVIGEANITTKLHTPEVCIGGDCRTSWPAGGSVSVDSPWDNNSIQTFIRDTYPRFVNVSDTLFVDDSNTRVGVNTSSPNRELTVVGDANITGDVYAAASSVYLGDKKLSNSLGTLLWGDDEVAIANETILGTFESKTRETVYQADSDGLVLASMQIRTDVDDNAWVYGIANSFSPPTTVRAYDAVSYSAGNHWIWYASFTMPVKKGEYWNVSWSSQNGYDPQSVIILWIPLQGAGGAEQKWNVSSDNLYPENLQYKVGINTTTPNKELTVVGDANVTGSVYTGASSVYIGDKQLSNDAGTLEWGGVPVSNATQPAKYGYAGPVTPGVVSTATWGAISGLTATITVNNGDIIQADAWCSTENDGCSAYTGIRPYLSSGSANLIVAQPGWTIECTNPSNTRGMGLWEATADGTLTFVNQINTQGWTAATAYCYLYMHVIGSN